MEPISAGYAIGTIVFAAASEIIGMLPVKSNSVIQAVLNIGKLIFGGKGTGK